MAAATTVALAPHTNSPITNGETTAAAAVGATTPTGATPEPEEDHPSDVNNPKIQARYFAAAATMGRDLQSKISRSTPQSGNPVHDFLTDHNNFMYEINYPFKLRRIGGSELNLYGLYKAVLERGGLQSVIYNRAFKMVAKTLMLPKTCTSAAFILRSEYEKLLYAYEQKHVWNRDRVNLPTLVQADRRKSLAVRPMTMRPRQPTPPPAPAAAIHPLQKPSTRPRRHAAQTSTNPTAINNIPDDPCAFPYFPRRNRLTGLDENSLDTREEHMIEDEVVNDNAPHAMYVPGLPAERDRVVTALQSPLPNDIAWALGTLNALSFDVRNSFDAKGFPYLLEALHGILYHHMEDVLQKRPLGVIAGTEEINEYGARDVEMSAVDVRLAGVPSAGGVTGASIGITGVDSVEQRLRSNSLQQYANLFNMVDPMAADREQCAVVAGNILRNMSFFDSNAIFLSNAQGLLSLSAAMIENVRVVGNLRDGLMDMWINVSPYLNASADSAGENVLKTCIKLLDPFREGADMNRFTNCGEVLARLAACPDRNEKAITDMFHVVLPRVVDMLGGRHRKYVNAGLAALCNLSAFDWPARDQIARVPRSLDRLVGMLADVELAPRAAVTLLNLAESPSNRSVLMVYERRLLEHSFTSSPAAGTVSSVLYELDND